MEAWIKSLTQLFSQLEDMRKLKIERKNQFVEVLQQIHNIWNEFWRDTKDNLWWKIIIIIIF
jgi:hypothetical protein